MGVQCILPRPMGKPIGEITRWRDKNVEDLPRQPKYTNPCPWRNPYKGNHKGGAAKGRLELEPVASFSQSMSPWRSTATPFTPKITKCVRTCTSHVTTFLSKLDLRF